MAIKLLVPVYALLCLISFNSMAQTSYNLSGKVYNTDTGEGIDLATIVLNDYIGTYTDKEGNFNLSGLKAGEYKYVVMYLGFQSAEGTLTIERNTTDFSVGLSPLSIGLENIVVTATSSTLGSTSRIDESAIIHIQPKSVDDLLQLLPGNLTSNPDLSTLGQATLREISNDLYSSGNGTNNSALGTSVILDGAPLSNDANLQSLSGTLAGGLSNNTGNTAMAAQTTAARGVDTRTISPDNVEYMEVIRGIPSVEYGNLTSGVVIIKTKTGVTPFELKLKADPNSKLVYGGKGFGLKRGGAINLGVDWSQSFGDIRKRYLGYDRITASAGYSNVFDLAGKPFSFNFKSSFYSNINNVKSDPELERLSDKYKNTNLGIRTAIDGRWNLNSAVVSNLDYSVAFSYAHQKDEFRTLITNPPGPVATSRRTGLYEVNVINGQYRSKYTIDGKPYDIYASLKLNRLFQLSGDNYNNIRLGADWRLDANKGDGLVYDEQAPPTFSTTTQVSGAGPIRTTPNMSNLGVYLEDRIGARWGTTFLTLQGGVRLTNIFIDRQKANRGDLLLAEPRINASYELLNSRNNSVFDQLSIAGGWGLSYKAPTLMYFYPDNAYFDIVSVNKYSSETDRLALMNTDVVSDLANGDLKATRSRKWETSLNFKIKKVNGFITFFNEKYTNEFGFTQMPHYVYYDTYNIPDGASAFQYANGQVTYKDQNGITHAAQATADTLMTTYLSPTNNRRTIKYGIEYSFDFGQINPIRTSVVVDGAWFHVDRKNKKDNYSLSSGGSYIRYMPSGIGSRQNRVNTNFRFITHIPAIKMIFTTTVQVVWYENYQNFWEDGNGNSRVKKGTSTIDYTYVNPIGFQDKKGNFTQWQDSFNEDSRYSNLIQSYTKNYFKKEVFKPWVMLNFRLTKEFGSLLDLSFMANNFVNTSRWHKYRITSGYKQIYPDLYFGAELRIKIGGLK